MRPLTQAQARQIEAVCRVNRMALEALIWRLKNEAGELEVQELLAEAHEARLASAEASSNGDAKLAERFAKREGSARGFAFRAAENLDKYRVRPSERAAEVRVFPHVLPTNLGGPLGAVDSIPALGPAPLEQP